MRIESIYFDIALVAVVAIAGRWRLLCCWCCFGVAGFKELV